MKTTKGTTYLSKGTKGPIQLTDVLHFVEDGQTALFKHNQTNEIVSSYFGLGENHLHVEVWEASKLKFNTYVGYESILLSDIVNGTVTQTVDIRDKLEKVSLTKTAFTCTVTFKIQLEEIWDFLIRF